MREALRWFGAFLLAFVVLGILGEILFQDLDVPRGFTSTMLALNVIGAGAVAFTVLATFATQRNAALTALRAEQARSEALLVNVLPDSIAKRLKASTLSIADQFESASILFADVVDFTPLARRLAPAEVVGLLDHLFSHFDTLVERHGLEKIRRSAIATWPQRVRPIPAPITRAGPRGWRWTCGKPSPRRRSPVSSDSSCGSSSTPVPSSPA